MKKFAIILLIGMVSFIDVVAQGQQRTLEVVGKATVKAFPEQVIFRIPLKIVDAGYLGCSNLLATTLNNLQKDLIEKGIDKEKVNTANYNISENIVFENGVRVQKGFKGEVSVMLAADYSPELVGKVLETVRELKLSYAINFSMSEEQKSRLTDVAMASAVEDAKQKAVILAKTAEVQLDAIVRVSYGMDQFRPEPFMSERIMASSSDAGQNELNLSPSLTSLFKSVLIVWEIK